MSLREHQAEMKELIASLEKIAPKNCSKPQSEMCSKCLTRVTSEKAVLIQNYLKDLRDLLNNNELLKAELETAVIELLNSN
jgi:hypothetical protein